MCGGLVVMVPGSSYQILFAILIMFFHLLVVLKLAPYKKDSEDWSCIICTLTLMLTSLGAYSMKLRSSPKETNIIGNVLITMTGMTVLACIVITVFVDCGLWNKLCRKKNNELKNTETNVSQTKVQPVDDVDKSTVEATRNFLADNNKEATDLNCLEKRQLLQKNNKLFKEDESGMEF